MGTGQLIALWIALVVIAGAMIEPQARTSEAPTGQKTTVGSPGSPASP